MCIQPLNGTSGLSYGDIWLLSTRNGKSCDHSLEHPCNLRKLWVVFSRYCCILSFVAFHVFLWIIKLNMLFYFPKYLQLFFLSNVPDYRNFLNQKAYDLMNFMHFLSVFFLSQQPQALFPSSPLDTAYCDKAVSILGVKGEIQKYGFICNILFSGSSAKVIWFSRQPPRMSPLPLHLLHLSLIPIHYRSVWQTWTQSKPKP